ncbi:hypothetical protein F5X99DRAFT_402285 [Biscogniauxia marginata]|nr:hypothetical protein F5X99DRAFT_402285 [Biscogniauxia marginata]
MASCLPPLLAGITTNGVVRLGCYMAYAVRCSHLPLNRGARERKSIAAFASTARLISVSALVGSCSSVSMSNETPDWVRLGPDGSRRHDYPPSFPFTRRHHPRRHRESTCHAPTLMA